MRIVGLIIVVVAVVALARSRVGNAPASDFLARNRWLVIGGILVFVAAIWSASATEPSGKATAAIAGLVALAVCAYLDHRKNA